MRLVLVENDGELFVPDEFDDLIELINIMLKVFFSIAGQMMLRLAFRQ